MQIQLGVQLLLIVIIVIIQVMLHRRVKNSKNKQNNDYQVSKTSLQYAESLRTEDSFDRWKTIKVNMAV